ncbi:AraC family transcriptional regulator [Paenibacillus campinasensis]|uniref:AraC family transcriptional regulator n=1 Tax=Paenibacillus campinasensis TaxID=66347 RepID=A0A268EJE5_9BACL|nr:AraC family transcriptional regulator [Paenibacillus campinasensis]PAD73235.1 AraC family transcriptional regulator [Paenibacillus campinasensis]
MEKIRYTLSGQERPLPLFVESVGYNPREEDFARPEGYPYFHWLQTVEGEGEFRFSGEEVTLSKGRGILLMPFTAHSYYCTGDGDWSTLYMTFGGASADSILHALGISSAVYTETEEFPFSELIWRMMDLMGKGAEFSRLDASEELYRFLIMLKKYGKTQSQHSLSHYYERIRPVVEWLERMYADNIGLQEMAREAGMSSQHLSHLFRQTFHMSPYAFLIQLRIREAKKLLVASPDITLKEVAQRVGFQDVSHFVATFKRIEHITPNRYRHLFN